LFKSGFYHKPAGNNDDIPTGFDDRQKRRRSISKEALGSIPPDGFTDSSSSRDSKA